MKHLRQMLAAWMLSLLVAGVAAAGDWPQFLGPHRDGTCAPDGVADAWPAGGPKLLWKKDVGQGFSGPVVADGRLILFHRVGDNECVECMDAHTGKRLFLSAYPTHYQDDFGFDPGPRATPTISRGRVYTFGADGMLNCWELANGHNVWHLDAKKQFTAGKGFFGMACSPLLEGDAVILNLGGERGAGVVAVDAATGKLLWKATDDEASYASPIAATIDGKRQVLVFTRAGLVSLEPASGGVLFRFPWRSRMNASVNAATPLVIDGQVFLSSSYNTGAVLLGLTRDGPRKIWSGDDSLSNHYATSVYFNGCLFGYHGRQEMGPSLRCIELKTGRVRWSDDNFGAGTLMLAGNRLLILTEKGELICAPATPDGFKPIGRAQILPFDSRAYPALAGGLYYARGKKTLVCVDLRAAIQR